MSNPYLEYYSNQAGSGLAGYQGYKYQRGHGFFSSLFQNIIKLLGKYLGKQALTTGVSVGQDLLQGENFKDSIKKRSKKQNGVNFDDAITRVKKFAQTGKGRKKRRKRRKPKHVSIIKKTKRKTKKKKSKKSIKKRSLKRKKSKKLDLSYIF